MLNAYCHILKKGLQKTSVLEKLSKRHARGRKRAYSRWPMSVRLHSRPMRLRVKSKRVMRLVLLPVSQVKRWRLRMLPDMLSPLLSMQPPLFVMPLIPPMPLLPQSKNVIGNIGICLNCV